VEILRGHFIEEPLDHHLGGPVDQALTYGRDGSANLHVAFVGNLGARVLGRELQIAFALHEADLTGAFHHQPFGRRFTCIGLPGKSPASIISGTFTNRAEADKGKFLLIIQILVSDLARAFKNEIFRRTGIERSGRQRPTEAHISDTLLKAISLPSRYPSNAWLFTTSPL